MLKHDKHFFFKSWRWYEKIKNILNNDSLKNKHIEHVYNYVLPYYIEKIKLFINYGSIVVSVRDCDCAFLN